MTDVFGACPLDCPDGCSWVVTVEDGEAVRLRGNREHPFTAGALCAKVNGYLEHARAPDRLLYPLRRVGRKGEGRFERISWDDGAGGDRRRGCTPCATSTAARRSGRSRAPGSLGYVQGLEGRAGQRLWNVLGASRHDMTICSVAGRVGATLHAPAPRRAWTRRRSRESKLILLWGTNTLTSGHHLWKFVLAARKQRRAHRRHRPAAHAHRRAQADEHLAPLPGHRRRARARAAVGGRRHGRRGPRVPAPTHTLGWDAFRERILEFPPDRVAAITGLAEGADRRARAAARDDAADRHPLHDGHAAPRRRRQRAAAAVRAAGRDRRLAVPGRRRVVLDQRALPRRTSTAIVRDDLLQRAGADAEHDAARRGAARPRRPAGEGARRLRRQPDGLATPTRRGARAASSARTCSRS